MMRRKKIAFKPVLRKPAGSSNASSDGKKSKQKASAPKVPKANASEQLSNMADAEKVSLTPPSSENNTNVSVNVLPPHPDSEVNGSKHSVEATFTENVSLSENKIASENTNTNIEIGEDKAVDPSSGTSVLPNAPDINTGLLEPEQPTHYVVNQDLSTIDSSAIACADVDEELVVVQHEDSSTQLKESAAQHKESATQHDGTVANLQSSKHKATASTIPTFPVNKSKEQIVKEQFGVEDKSIRQRNALKKLKNFETVNQNVTSEDWNNTARDALLMSDLIYCNPPKNAAKEIGFHATLRKMKIDKKQQKQSKQSSSLGDSQPNTCSLSATNDPDQTTSPDAATIAPQIRINEDGTIVIDEESLIINSSKPDTVVHDTPAVYENNITGVGHSNFRRFPPSKRPRWTEKQTAKFYEALKIVGADFNLMSAMFRNRNDVQLRKKFHLERRKHHWKIDEALKQQHLSKWTDDMFKPDSSSDEEVPKKRRRRKPKTSPTNETKTSQQLTSSSAAESIQTPEAVTATTTAVTSINEVPIT